MNMDHLAQRLLAANEAYRKGAATMTDATYDALEAQLRKHDPENPALAKVGAPGSDGWAKVKHPIDMGSLNKAQDEDEFMEWWAVRVPRTAVAFITEKLDGISIRLTYKNGELAQAATRGDGEKGEDITRNVSIMQGFPTKILYPGTCHVRGEIVCRKKDFAKHFPGESNPRNTASGTAKRQSNWRKAQYLTVIAYNITAENPDHQPQSRSAEIEKLEEWGFLAPSHFLVTAAEEVVQYRKDYIASRRELLDWEIDGLVIEIDDTTIRKAAGSRNMRPKGAVAFKFPHESAQTILRDIRWQVGNSGRITPVAVFDVVPLAGAQVKQASLHNISNIDALVAAAGQDEAFVGDVILVSRRNDVIPYVEGFLGTNEEDDNEFAAYKSLVPPKLCPACGAVAKMSGEYLMCSGDACPAQVLGSIRRWINKVGILHFGDALLTATIDAGLVKTIADIYLLKEPQFAALTMDGRRVGGMARRALKQVEAKREVTLDYFVGSLGIHLCGRKMTLLLMKAGFNDLGKLAAATERQMAAVEGFGPTKAKHFRQGFDARKKLILDILAAGVVIKEPVVVAVTGSAMAGKVVCMTGFRDKDLGTAIEAAGGTLSSGVSKKTTLLVAKDPSSTSGKAKKARGLGIEILSPEDMWKRLGGRP